MQSYISFEIFLVLLPLVHSVAIGLVPRDEVFSDVIRFMECKNEGGIDEGLLGFWPDVGATGDPTEVAVVDTLFRFGDQIFNGPGTEWEGNTTDKGSKISVEIPTLGKPSPNGLYVGYAMREFTEGGTNKKWRYNCFAKDDWEWDTCTSYVECHQRDAMKVNILGSDEVIHEWELASAKDIYGKFDQAFQDDQGMCKEDGIGIDVKGKTCSVKFECKSHGNKGVMDALREQLQKAANEPTLTKEEMVTIDRGQCELRGDCFEDADRLYRSVPQILNIAAHSLPQNPDAEFNTEIGYIKATVECEKQESLVDKICDALGVVFGAVELIEKFSKPAEIAGVAVEVGCAVVSELIEANE